ncbi:MAG: hypothetical protein AB7S90_14890, partial [Marinobacterium sp.]
MTFGSSNRAKARLLARRPRATAPLKQSIIWGLLSLVGLFIVGLWVITRLNLEYSQRTLAEFHQRQIEVAFTNSLDRVNSRLQQIEQDSLRLVRIGQRLKTSSTPGQQTELMQLLLERSELAGVGLWYGVSSDGVLGGAQVYRIEDGVQTASAQAGLELRKEHWEPLLTDNVSSNRYWWTPIYTHPLSGEP